MAAGSLPLAMAPDSRAASLRACSGVKAPWRPIVRRLVGVPPSTLPILQDVHLIASRGDLKTKALQVPVPQELVSAARVNRIHRALGDLGQHAGKLSDSRFLAII